jgi:uncharacterized protein YjiS (DUF1127 family)
MTYFRTLHSDVDNLFRPPRHGFAPAAPHYDRSLHGGLAADVLVSAHALARTAVGAWRRAAVERRSRRELMELDDRMLEDIGLSRIDVHFGDLERLSRERREGGSS